MFNYELIKKRRKELNMTQSQLAEKVGVTSAYIHQLEKNIKKNPSLEIQLKLANVLNIEIDSLAGTKKVIYSTAIKEIDSFLNKYPQNKDDISKILHTLDNCFYSIYDDSNTNTPSYINENIKLLSELIETIHLFLQSDLLYPPDNNKHNFINNSLNYINKMTEISNNILKLKLKKHFNEGD